MKRTPEEWQRFAQSAGMYVGNVMPLELQKLCEAVRAEALTEAADRLRNLGVGERHQSPAINRQMAVQLIEQLRDGEST